MQKGREKDNQDILYKHTKTQTIPVSATLVDGTRVEGNFHLAPKLRLIDLLNRHTSENSFLAVTNAKITYPNGERGTYNFLSLNRRMIILCFPKGDEVFEEGIHHL